MQEEEKFWPDGTRRSTGNVFTSHGFKIGAPTLPSPLRQRHVKAGFGAKGGTYQRPGIINQAPDFNTVKKRA